MIKLTYKELNSEGFNEGLKALMNQKNFATFQATYNVSKIIRKFNKELSQARELFAQWTKEYTAKNEDGTPKMATNPHPLFPFEIVEGKAEEFSKKIDEFMNTEIVIEAMPVKATDLENVHLSPKQILALEPIFDSASLEELSQH